MLFFFLFFALQENYMAGRYELPNKLILRENPGAHQRERVVKAARDGPGNPVIPGSSQRVVEQGINYGHD